MLSAQPWGLCEWKNVTCTLGMFSLTSYSKKLAEPWKSPRIYSTNAPPWTWLFIWSSQPMHCQQAPVMLWEAETERASISIFLMVREHWWWVWAQCSCSLEQPSILFSENVLKQGHGLCVLQVVFAIYKTSFCPFLSHCHFIKCASCLL